MRRPLLALIPALTLAACGASPSELEGGDFVPEVSERGAFQLRIDVDDGAFRRGVNALTVRAFTPGGAAAALLEVRARMPGHAHPTVRPSVRPLADGWRVDDLALTMPGRWEVTFRFAHEGTLDEALAVTSLR